MEQHVVNGQNTLLRMVPVPGPTKALDEQGQPWLAERLQQLQQLEHPHVIRPVAPFSSCSARQDTNEVCLQY